MAVVAVISADLAACRLVSPRRVRPLELTAPVHLDAHGGAARAAVGAAVGAATGDTLLPFDLPLDLPFGLPLDLPLDLPFGLPLALLVGWQQRLPQRRLQQRLRAEDPLNGDAWRSKSGGNRRPRERAPERPEAALWHPWMQGRSSRAQGVPRASTLSQ